MRIDSGPVSPTDVPDIVSKSKWRDLMRAKRDFIKTNIKYDCRCLLEFVGQAQDMFESLGYASADDMIRNGYELDPVEVEYAITWLRLKDPAEAATFAEAVKSGREIAAATMAKAEVMRPHRRPKAEEVKVDNINFNKTQGGSSKDYLAARIKRDRPDIAERVEAGEFPSMRQAAIAAGIIKVPTKLEKATKAFVDLSSEDKQRFSMQLKDLLMQQS